MYAAGKVVRFTPNGHVEREVQIPAANVTSIAFGGANLRTAYVTSSARAFGAAERTDDPLAGAVFAFEAPAPGVAVPLLDAAYFT